MYSICQYIFRISSNFMKGKSMVKYIKELAKIKKITISRLEQTLGFSNGSIRHWDEKPPAYDKLLKVANYFEITIDELIGNTEQRNPKEVLLIEYYKESDERGQNTILSVAELEAQRSRKEEEPIKLKPFA